MRFIRQPGLQAAQSLRGGGRLGSPGFQGSGQPGPGGGKCCQVPLALFASGQMRLDQRTFRGDDFIVEISDEQLVHFAAVHFSDSGRGRLREGEFPSHLFWQGAHRQVQAGFDGAERQVEDGGDLGVRQVPVVAQDDDHAEFWVQETERMPDRLALSLPCLHIRIEREGMLGQFLQGLGGVTIAPPVEALVDGDAVEPGGESRGEGSKTGRE